jgi:hypothetical protein
MPQSTEKRVIHKPIQVGDRFGRLTVIKRLSSRRGRKVWKCRCRCGRIKAVLDQHLKIGSTRSCGCLQRQRATSHGLSRSAEYVVWKNIKSRCYDRNQPAYRNYGGRGIRMCKRWFHSFEAFLEDMGPRPGLSYSIDRIDNDRGYRKSNCRWVTATDQNRNRRNNRMITYRGRDLSLAEWCDKLGLNYYRTYERIFKCGWSLERAFSRN